MKAGGTALQLGRTTVTEAFQKEISHLATAWLLSAWLSYVLHAKQHFEYYQTSLVSVFRYIPIVTCESSHILEEHPQPAFHMAEQGFAINIKSHRLSCNLSTN